MNITSHTLRISIDMERDKREFYAIAGRRLISLFDNRLFRRMAGHAMNNLKALKDVCEASEIPGTFAIGITYMYGSETPWARAIRELKKTQAITELDILKMAMGLQLKNFDFYADLSMTATNPFEKGFYYRLACQERKNFLILHDAYSYMVDPEGWFESVERSALDGA